MSIFNTTANTEFNAFNDPFNPVNMNRGPWGVDPNYLTPSYTAPYRPPYSGGTHVASQNPGFFRSIYGLSPFGMGPDYGVGSAGQDSDYYDAIGSRATDFPTAFGQRVATPIAAFAGAYGLSRAWQVGNASRYSRYAGNAWTRMWGASAFAQGAGASSSFAVGGLGRTVSGFTAMGQGFGRGIAKGLIGGAAMFSPGLATARGAAMFVGGAAAIGGAVASLIAPALVAEAGIKAADKMIFEPYIGVRENQNMLRQSFAGVTFGGDQGDPYTGRGLSRAGAARIGTQLASFGMRDQVFSSREVATITSMSAQTGLLDNVMPEQISKRMESIVRQLKLVMSITGSTDFKETVALMAKLQMGGVAPGGISTALSGIGALASAAGISTQRMMNTVGAQGQYLFQANGMTPFLGQLSAATSMAGFASAFRTGLISPEMMARLGGVEGATQLSTTAQINGAQTIYNSIRNFNRYTSGVGGTGVIGNVMNFGATFARNPLEAMGALGASQGRNLSEQFRNEGMMGLHNQIMDIARVIPGVQFDRNGHISGNVAHTILTQQMGLTNEQANAYLTQIASFGNQQVVDQMLAGVRSSQISTMRDLLEQGGQTRFASMFSPISKLYRDIRSSAARTFGGGVEGVGGAMDSFARMWTSATVGSPDELLEQNLRGSGGDTRALSLIKTWKLGTVDKDRRINDIVRIQELARQGNKDAILVLQSNNKDKISDALSRLSISGMIDGKYSRSTNENFNLASVIMGSERYSEATDVSNVTDKYKKALAGAGSLFSDHTTDAEHIEGFNIARDLAEGGEINRADKDTATKIQRLGQLTGKSLTTGVELRETIENLYNYADENRIGRGMGQVTAGGVFSNANRTFEDRVAFNRAMKGFSDQRAAIQKAAASMQIDTSSFLQANAGVDMGQAVTLFGEYVQQFGVNVKGIGKEVKPESSPSSILPGNNTLRILESVLNRK